MKVRYFQNCPVFNSLMDFKIDKMRAFDRDSVLRIYSEGLATGNATFETRMPAWETWYSSHLRHSRLVARHGETILGWAALSSVSGRNAYSGVAEVSIYVAETARGNGVGDKLMQALIKCSEEHGIWTLQASIFPENSASVRLHLRNGFREAGRRERIGKLGGVWRDTILFERRSASVGIV